MKHANTELKSANKFRNEQLEEETERINAEFQSILMQQSKPRRSFKGQGNDDVGMDKFYEIMGEFYSSDIKKHASPTKRLIQQKDAAFKHKEFLSRKIASTQEY